MKRLTTLAAAAALGAGLAAPASQAQELRLSTFVPPGHIIYREIIIPFGQDLEKATNGQVKLTGYPSMQLGGKPPELFRQAVDGVADLVFTLPGYTSPAFPRVGIIELPGLKEDGFKATDMMWDLLDPYLLPEFKGTKVIALWGAEDAGLMSRAKAYRTMEDLKGLRIRAPSAAQAKQIEYMGGVPIAAPITQVYPGLERGTMDGAMVPFTTILDFKLGEVAKGYTIAGPIFGRSVFLIAMNQKKYDSLSPSARAAIDKLSGRELSRKATGVYIKRAEESVASVRGKADVYELPKSEQERISKQLRPIIDEWIKEMEGKGVPARDMLRRAGFKGA
ncbi:MAG TPA: TRAP transporter substrate-binding protein [Burkholderiales bacterium]|nr:TRAP transporter substrate-binding protein [Burkholderiales bacterium]